MIKKYFYSGEVHNSIEPPFWCTVLQKCSALSFRLKSKQKEGKIIPLYVKDYYTPPPPSQKRFLEIS